ncbi:AraC family transcriptional regulator [Prolixibacteraceae bacterium Z1-6]|uniref:AraC family transcriptional regulator n=1 Tax=Draconibacterium aestuarii TaxID=2998507 RepID=A0A9X3F6Q9_9BACT|nr:AraC family transcriptional regulator [Prolixibacteraceae bacterium Z1-6]
MIYREGQEHNPHDIFKKLSDTQGGNWDGEEMNFSSDFGHFEIISYEYLDGFYIGVTSIRLNQKFVLKNIPSENNHYISLRIGFHDIVSEDSKGSHPTEGIFLFNTLQEYCISYPENKPLQWLVIRFPYNAFEELYKNWNSTLRSIFNRKEPWFYYYPMVPDIEHLVRDIFEVKNNKTNRRFMFFAKTIELIGRLEVLLENKSEEITSSVHPDDIEAMFQVKEMLLSDYAKKPDVAEISKNFGMSISKLQRAFKAVFNMPVLQFFNHHRMEEAYRKIKHSEKSLSEISFDLGFSHLSHMSKAFKKHFGFAPSNIREVHELNQTSE